MYFLCFFLVVLHILQHTTVTYQSMFKRYSIISGTYFVPEILYLNILYLNNIFLINNSESYNLNIMFIIKNA